MTRAQPAEPSPRRLDLCSNANAQRVAIRMHDAGRQAVSIVRTGDPLQPLRVVRSTDVEDPSTQIAIVMV